MAGLKKLFILIFLMSAGYYLYQRNEMDLTMVYPDSCVFTIDPNLSRAIACQIKAFIDDAYKKNKNPTFLLSALEKHFPEIQSIVIDMHQVQALHFTIQGHQPIFILNDALVICQHGKQFEKSIFRQKILQNLENITFDGVLTEKNKIKITQFFLSMSDIITQEFSVRWVDQDTIWLDSKIDPYLSLLVGYDLPVRWQDIAECRRLASTMQEQSIKEKKGKTSKKKERWVCDLRFDRQIILFSTK